MIRWYRLDGRTPVLVDDVVDLYEEWQRREIALRSGDDPYRVARTPVADSVYVSTVFLGLDHRFGDGPPVLFETMVFGLDDDEFQRRYTTWDDAERGHAAVVETVTELIRLRLRLRR